MTNRAHAIDAAVAVIDRGEFRAELARLVSIPTESQKPDRAPELYRYLDDVLRKRFEELGFECKLFPNPCSGPPFLVAQRFEDADFITVLGYGHADVIRGLEGSWQRDRSPWQLEADGDRLYGRGTADNKGQLTVNLAALQNVIEQRGGKLGWNVKFLVEAGEELGSPGLHEFCLAQRELLAADVLIASDGPRLAADAPTVFLGSRGAVNFTLRVEPRPAAHHSGNWGGLLSNPAITLSHAIAHLVEQSGRIALPELRPTHIPGDVRDALSRCVVSEDGDGPAIDHDWGEPGLTPAEKLYGWNSLEVLALSSGTPAAPISAIPGKAVATCQLRFVVGTDIEAVVPAIRRSLAAAGLTSVIVERTADKPFVATRVPLDSPWVEFASRSIESTLGHQPVILPNLGGSLPNDAFAEILAMPTLWIPHSYPNCAQHAPDEHMLESIAREGLAMMAGIYWDLGDPGMVGR